jgi:acyl carrier protein
MTETERAYVAPRNETEETLVMIWRDVLDKEKIGVTDDYFEIGGNSLKAMMLVKKVVDKTGVSIPLRTLFEKKTIERIAHYIRQSKQPLAIPSKIETNELPVFEASYNQLAYFDDWSKGDHVVVSHYDYSHLDIEAFTGAVNRLVARHEILRTGFIKKDGIIKQQLLAPDEMKIEVPVFETGISDTEMENVILNEYARSFDFFNPPLFQIKMYRLLRGGYKVLVTIHHIITDGYSGGIIRDELRQLYAASLTRKEAALQPLSFQYRHFAIWQNNFVQSAEGARHKEYWIRKLEHADPRIQFPSRSIPVTDKENVTKLSQVIDGIAYEEIDRFTKENGVTGNILLMGVLTLLLDQLYGKNDVALFTAVTGRNSKLFGAMDLSGLIGYFANVIVVRNRVEQDRSLVEYLHKVQHNFIDDLEYAAYPFAKLIHEIPGMRSNDLLQASVFYNYHNYKFNSEAVLNTDEKEKEEASPQHASLQMGFLLGVKEFKNCLQLQFIFNPRLVDYSHRLQIKERYLTLLKQVVADSKMPVKQLPGQSKVHF